MLPQLSFNTPPKHTQSHTGYHVTTLTDCMAATSQEAHDAAVKHTFPMFSVPKTHTEFIAALS